MEPQWGPCCSCHIFSNCPSQLQNRDTNRELLACYFACIQKKATNRSIPSYKEKDRIYVREKEETGEKKKW